MNADKSVLDSKEKRYIAQFSQGIDAKKQYVCRDVAMLRLLGRQIFPTIY